MSLRRRTRRRLIVLAVVVGAIVAMGWALSSGKKPVTAGPYVPPAPEPSAPGRTLDPSPLPPEVKLPDGVPPIAPPVFPAGAMGSGNGGGSVSELPPHRARVTFTSDGRFGYVAYHAPTAKKVQAVKVGTSSWEVEFTVYGNPDYVGAWGYTEPGTEVASCTIEIDGVVTDRQVARGPWAGLVCRG